MVEKRVISPIREKVIYESKLDLSILRKKGNEKTYHGWLIQKIKESRQDNNLEVCELLMTCYKKYNEFKKEFSKPIKEIEIEGLWKGKGDLEINNLLFDEDINIRIPMKDKETKEIKYINKIIPRENVNRILCFINKWKVGEVKNCYDFEEPLNLPNWEEVWKKRTKVYFLQYYYPIKILEAMKIIKYGGRGEITRIR